LPIVAKDFAGTRVNHNLARELCILGGDPRTAKKRSADFNVLVALLPQFIEHFIDDIKRKCRRPQ
jgi:hypothetical protein